MRIQVPRERRLTGRELADFQKERARIDELMRRAPVSSRIFTDPAADGVKAEAGAGLSTAAIVHRVRK